MNPVDAQTITELLPGIGYYIRIIGIPGSLEIVNMWALSLVAITALATLAGLAMVRFGLDLEYSNPHPAKILQKAGWCLPTLVFLGIAACWAISLPQERKTQGEALAQILNGNLKIHTVFSTGINGNEIAVTTKTPTEIIFGKEVSQDGPTILLPLETAQKLNNEFFQPRGLALR